MAILIKRYANRKLYNTDTSRYITLKGIAELLDAGEEVRVVDKETGEDITSVALSQILLDSSRSNTSPPDSLLSQILGRGGDALYDALRRGVDDASEGIGDFQERIRNLVNATQQQFEDSSRGETKEGAGGNGRKGKNHFFQPPPEIDQIVQNAVERVFKLLDLPRRSDVETLNENLARVASAVETLEEAFAKRDAEESPDNSPESPSEPK